MSTDRPSFPGWISALPAGVTSVITMTKLLVKPYRQSGVHACYALLSTYPHLEWTSPTLEIADLAAEIRATHRLRTPDPLQAATAVQGQATAILTNGPVFNPISQLMY